MGIAIKIRMSINKEKNKLLICLLMVFFISAFIGCGENATKGKIYKNNNVGSNPTPTPEPTIDIDTVVNFKTVEFGSDSTELARGFTTDDQDNLYVIGGTYSDLYSPNADPTKATCDLAISKFDKNGAFLWGKQMGSTNNDVAYDIAIDSGNNIYLAGWTQGDLDQDGPEVHFGYHDAFLIKLDSSGNLIWSKQIGSDGVDCAYGIDIDSMDNVYIAGETRGDFGGETHLGAGDVFVSKFDSDGNVVWTRFKGTAGGSEYGRDVAVDSRGFVYATGVSSASMDGQPFILRGDVFLIKLDSVDGYVYTESTRMHGTDVEDLG